MVLCLVNLWVLNLMDLLVLCHIVMIMFVVWNQILLVSFDTSDITNVFCPSFIHCISYNLLRWFNKILQDWNWYTSFLSNDVLLLFQCIAHFMTLSNTALWPSCCDIILSKSICANNWFVFKKCCCDDWWSFCSSIYLKFACCSIGVCL